ncbi:DUF7529 family protein [Halomarina oriensis]|uniref:Uncharacterized protein n=1 Tax=Halomarina oriensis TaxID=671145 RepID=A0A6B0GS87_9EURY|nr:hypothetical protein [Halomarina oriensis]MWG34955.1 hypothetical protein [Halomarina oriensis]
MDQPPEGDRERPIDRAAGHWEAVVDDMAATADRLREAGADVVELHPGDIVPRADIGGFDVLVPDAEFERLRETVADTALTATDVFRAEESGVTFAVAVLAASDGSAAVCCPLYYDRADETVQSLQRAARDGDPLRTFVRPLANEEAVVLQFDDADVFFEADATDETGESGEQTGSDGTDAPEADGDE